MRNVTQELYMTVETIEEKRMLLAACNKAIRNLLFLGAQSYAIGRRSVTKFNLSELYKLRRLLMDEIAAEETPPGLLANTRVSVFDRR